MAFSEIPRLTQKHRHEGFTLLEILTSLAVTSILLTAAVPAMQDFIIRNRMSTEVNTFVASLYLARSEAVKRLQNVVLCASTTLSDCSGSNDWESGWIVFVDNDKNGGVSSGETILQRNSALPNRFKIIGNQNSFAYDPTGQLYKLGLSLPNGNNKFCDTGNIANTRAVYISNEGRVRVNQLTTSGCS